MNTGSSLDIAFVGRGTLVDNATTLRALGLGAELVRKGHRVTLYLPDLPRNRELRASIRSGIEVRLAGSRRLELGPKLLSMLDRSHDVVHCLNVGLNSYMTGWLYGSLRRRSLVILDVDEDMPLIVRGGVHRSIVSLIERFALRTADGVICASGYLTEKLQGRTSLPVEYFPYAADLRIFDGHGTRPTTASKDPFGPIHALYMGSFQTHFDLPVLLHGIARAVESFPGLDLTMVGDGPERLALQDLAESLLPGRVKFPGFVPDLEIPETLSSADLFLLPIKDTVLNRSRCPNKIFQYMAARRPIITNRVGEVETALGSDAHYFAYGSPEDFSRAIGEAISAPRVVPPERLHQYSWARRTEEYLQYLERVRA